MKALIVALVAGGLLLGLTGCAGVRITTDPPPAPPAFVPGAPWVQTTPGTPFTTRDGVYLQQHTFCLPPGMHVRVFENGQPGYNSYSASYLDTSQRPHGDPLECP